MKVISRSRNHAIFFGNQNQSLMYDAVIDNFFSERKQRSLKIGYHFLTVGIIKKGVQEMDAILMAYHQEVQKINFPFYGGYGKKLGLDMIIFARDHEIATLNDQYILEKILSKQRSLNIEKPLDALGSMIRTVRI
jgi:hypothetical protein